MHDFQQPSILTSAKEKYHCLLQQSEANLTLTAGRNLLNLSYSLLIWNANSLVWHITSTETWKV